MKGAAGGRDLTGGVRLLAPMQRSAQATRLNKLRIATMGTLAGNEHTDVRRRTGFVNAGEDRTHPKPAGSGAIGAERHWVRQLVVGGH